VAVIASAFEYTVRILAALFGAVVIDHPRAERGVRARVHGGGLDPQANGLAFEFGHFNAVMAAVDLLHQPAG